MNDSPARQPCRTARLLPAQTRLFSRLATRTVSPATASISVSIVCWVACDVGKGRREQVVVAGDEVPPLWLPPEPGWVVKGHVASLLAAASQ